MKNKLTTKRKNIRYSDIPKSLVPKLIEDYKNGGTLTEISVYNRIGVPTLRKLLSANGVEIRKKGPPFDKERFEEMRALYEEGYSYADIGKKFNLSRQGVHLILGKAGVESRGRRLKKERSLTDLEKQIAEAYDANTRPADIIAKYPNLNYSKVLSIVNKAGVEVKPRGFFNRRNDYDTTCVGIVTDYQNGVLPADIAEKYGLCGRTEIYKFLKRAGVKVHHRNFSKSVSEV